MKKRLFSFRLYADGMKQLRTIGVLCILALNLIGVLTPLLTWLDRLDTNYSAQTVNFIQKVHFSKIYPRIYPRNFQLKSSFESLSDALCFADLSLSIME